MSNRGMYSAAKWGDKAQSTREGKKEQEDKKENEQGKRDKTKNN
jgi:hypothetical protein